MDKRRVHYGSGMNGGFYQLTHRALACTCLYEVQHFLA